MYTGSQRAPAGDPGSLKHTFHHAGLPPGHPAASITLSSASQHVTSDPEAQRQHCEGQLGKQMARRLGFPCAKGSDLASWGSPAGRATGPSHLAPGHPCGPRFSKTMRSFIYRKLHNSNLPRSDHQHRNIQSPA